MANSSVSASDQNDSGLGFWTLLFMGTGAVIGAGIVTYVGIAVGYTGRAAWIAYATAVLGASMTQGKGKTRYDRPGEAR